MQFNYGLLIAVIAIALMLPLMVGYHASIVAADVRGAPQSPLVLGAPFNGECESAICRLHFAAERAPEWATVAEYAFAAYLMESPPGHLGPTRPVKP